MSEGKPQDTYIRVLYKINEGYSSYQIEQDLIPTINFYSNKQDYTKEDLEELERTCKSEWQKAIIFFCDSIINRLCLKDKTKEIMNQEIDEAKRIKERVRRNNLGLSDYENVFDSDFSKLRVSVNTKLAEQKWESKRFYWGLFWGGVIGFVLGVVSTILLHLFGLV